MGGRRVVVFNADDFGLTAGVNAGIVGAHRRGIVRAASLMVTTPGFADAVALARATPSLDLGVHLALTGVAPLLPASRVPSLVDRRGRFPALGAWLARALAGLLRPAEVRAELRAQLVRALETGLPFSHLDGHHHIHVFAPVAPVVGELAREFGIAIVRRIRDRAPGARGPGGPGAARARGRLLAAADGRWGGAFDGLARGDAFRGFAFPTDPAGWAALAASCPPGVTEIMCHPGLADPAVRALDPYVAQREVELRWLCDRRVAGSFAAAGVALGDFAALRGGGGTACQGARLYQKE